MNDNKPVNLFVFYRRWASDRVSDEALAKFASLSRIVTKEKGEILFSPPTESPQFYILLDGIIKTYILGPDGTENTYAIYFKPGMSISMTKDMINIPGIHCKALTNCKMIQLIGYSPFELAEEFPDLWREIVIALQPFYYGMMDKLRAGYTMTAKERYLWFLNKYPYVVDKISQVEVANFLGITPQSLSRIRTELAEEQEVTPSK